MSRISDQSHKRYENKILSLQQQKRVSIIAIVIIFKLSEIIPGTSFNFRYVASLRHLISYILTKLVTLPRRDSLRKKRK